MYFRTSALAASALLACLTITPDAPAHAAGQAETGQTASRIVSVGGTVTEIIYALGAGDRIVAVDSTSLYPEDASAKPDVGYMRQVAPEGVLAQNPDLILLDAGTGPADAVAILKSGPVPVTTIGGDPDIHTIGAKIRAVGEAIGKQAEAETLASSVEQGMDRLEHDLEALPQTRKRVLFILSLANGRVMAAGKGTAADAMLNAAGAVNAVPDIHGYKPLTDEAIIAAAPDTVLVMANGGAHVTAEEAFALPVLKNSPAGRDGAFIAMDALYLLGLGPRTPDAARELANRLYPEVIKP